MTTDARALRLVLAAALIVLIAPVSAQQAKSPKASKLTDQDLATAKPGRDPGQAVDEEYTKKIKEYTTETFFNSPLTDYLPASGSAIAPASRNRFIFKRFITLTSTLSP